MFFAYRPEVFCDHFSALFRKLLLAAIGAAVALAVWPAVARDLDDRHAQSPLKEWFDGLRSGQGPCCSDADGSVLSDTDWDTSAGRYRVRVPRRPNKPSEMEWVVVPEDAVITEPNRAGKTMVWPYYGYLGVSIRCFMPGSMM